MDGSSMHVKSEKVPHHFDFSDLTILDSYGVERVPLQGSYGPDALADLFIYEWVSYFECHKCGRSDYCKFAERLSPKHHRMRDIKCGVVVDVLKNFVSNTYHLLSAMTRQQVQDYLDGAFFLYRFVYDTEQAIGIYMDADFIGWYGERASAMYGRISDLREMANAVCRSLRGLPGFESRNGILLVEGWTEKIFLDTLQKSHLLWFLHRNVETYGGKGNKSITRIEMLLQRYLQQGYKIYIQGDADGGGTDIFRRLIDKGLVECGCVFVFRHDFETAVPADLLLSALQSLGELSGVAPDLFAETIASRDDPVGRILLDEFALDIGPIKPDIASALADKLNSLWDWAWWEDDGFMQTGLGQFLRFVQTTA